MIKGRSVAITLAALVVAILAAAVTVAVSLFQPWIGVTLRPDMETGLVRVVSVADDGPARQIKPGTGIAFRGDAARELELVESDLVEEPDFFERYDDLARFQSRQSQLIALLENGPVRVKVGDAEWSEAFTATRRPLNDLPSHFWLQILVGIASTVLGAWVWSMRTRDPATALFALAGAMILGSAYPAAIYSSREVALNGEFLRVLSAINHGSTFVFGMATIAIFLTYPKKLLGARWLWILPGIFVPWLVLDMLRVLPSQTVGIQLPITIQMLAIIVLVCLQWWVNRADLRAKEALLWFGLAMVVGAGAFVAAIILPVLFDVPPMMKQAHAFAFFLLIYTGLGIGISRSRLFELDVWAFRILFYSVGAVVLLVVDAALIYQVSLDRPTAFGASLLMVGFLYLPMRDYLARFFSRRPALDRQDLLKTVVDAAFGDTGLERSQRWRKLFAELFDPLEVIPVADEGRVAELRDEGLELFVPGVAGATPLLMRRAYGGRGLFRAVDAETANELVSMMEHVEKNRLAYERGAQEERSRIAADLHDDVGARLLGGIHQNDPEEIKMVLREAMADIRTIVTELSGDRMPLRAVLADLRHETGLRLEKAGIDLNWKEIGSVQNAMIDYPVYKSLTSSYREIVSNVIRHASARRFDTEVTGRVGSLAIAVDDDGVGLDLDNDSFCSKAGNGLRNLQRRIAELDGNLTIGTSPMGGARIELSLPVTEARG